MFNFNCLVNHRERAIKNWSQGSFFKKIASKALSERLKYLKRNFNLALDFGSNSGELSNLILSSGKVNEIINVEFSASFAESLKKKVLLTDINSFPFCANKFDAFFSSLSFHWVNNPKIFLNDVLHTLKSDGFFLINFFGGKTLVELRDVLISSELEILNGSYQRISPFSDIKTIGDTFKSTGFEMTVVDSQLIRLTHKDLISLVNDIRIMGETSNLIGRSSYLRKDVFKRASEIYKKNYSLSNNKIFSTFEIITLTGWKPKI